MGSRQELMRSMGPKRLIISRHLLSPLEDQDHRLDT